MHHAGGTTYPAAMLSYRHFLRHMSAQKDEDLNDLGIYADRKSPVEVVHPNAEMPHGDKTNYQRSKHMPVEIPVDKWPGTVRTITLGATAADGGTRSHTITVGGAKSLPYMHFEGEMPNKPVVAIEIRDRGQKTGLLYFSQTWGEVVDDPGLWAKAAEQAGADLIEIMLSVTDKDGHPNTPEAAVASVKAVLKATGLPVLVFGPGQAELDNTLLVAVAEATKGERLVLGICEDKNYRTIVATAMANGHLVSARTPMDVNLSKQFNILITDMGLPAGSCINGSNNRCVGIWDRVWILCDGALEAGCLAG